MQGDRPNGVLGVICPSVARAGVKTAQPLDRLILQSNPVWSDVPPLRPERHGWYQNVFQDMKT